MAVVHSSAGFTGEVGQSEEARRMALLGPRFNVAGQSDWLVGAGPGDRVVNIAPGTAQACGVLDRTLSTDSVQLPANAGSSVRYDLIVARFTWAVGGGGTVAFTSITGLANGTLGPLVRTPGTQYDAVIGMVSVAVGQGALNASNVLDARTWLGEQGIPSIATSANSLLMSTLDINYALDISNGRLLYRSGNLWSKWGGPVEILARAGSFGNSGLAPQNATTNVQHYTFTSPVAGRGFVHYSCSVVAGANALQEVYVRLSMNSFLMEAPYGQVTQADPEKFTISTPVLLAAGNNVLDIDLQLGGGPACGLRYSSVLITN